VSNTSYSSHPDAYFVVLHKLTLISGFQTTINRFDEVFVSSVRKQSPTLPMIFITY